MAPDLREWRAGGEVRHVRFVAIDIGQSGSRVRSTDGFAFTGGPAFDAQAGVLTSIERTLTAAGTPHADVLSLSLTGLRGLVPDPQPIAERCHERTGAVAVAVADDGFAAHAGALGGADGVVLAVGSGVVAVARHDTRAAHRDGDGPIFGDDGGGFWIGRAGLRAAVRANEDRGPTTRLVSDIEAVYGPLRDAIRSTPDPEAMRWCIDVAQLVLQAAGSGDAVAVAIREAAAERLAATAAAAWKAVGPSDAQIPVSYTGGVMADAPLRDALERHLRRLLPHVLWQPPLGDNLDGALAIARGDQSDIPPLLRWWHQ